jgi:hypothetical protein
MPDRNPRRPTNAGVLAGTYIIGAMLALALIGGVVGALVGAVALCAVAGLLIGFFVGIWRVYVEFRDL